MITDVSEKTVLKFPLPEPFQEEMRSLLDEEYEQYVKSFDDPRSLGLRVNTLRLTREECRDRLPCDTWPVPWIANGLFYEDHVRLSKDPYYYAGLYYLQEPSAMTPASLLPVKPGDMVLDLCAAPGGKGTELGARLRGEGMLVANDISNSRAKGLLKNLELFGIANLCVTSEPPERLAAVFPGFFDSILIDAPCSGEGMFRKEPAMIQEWVKKGPEYYSRIQKEIVREGIFMVKPGGYLLYSTCTFSRAEDEELIRWVLNTFEEMELVPLPLFEGARDGIGLSGCLRLFPHRIRGEGHFMALLRKKKTGSARETVPQRKQEDHGSGRDQRGRRPLPGKAGQKDGLDEDREFWSFLGDTKLHWDRNRLVKRRDKIYYLPEGFPGGAGLRYLRTGLFMGTITKGRFEPSQAMAMVLGEGRYSNCVSFHRDDERVIRYLKGETVVLQKEEGPRSGWCLVCVDGFALGFAKGNQMTLKNKYYPGWRWQ